MRILRHVVALAALAAAGAIVSSPAQAAPQVLGLVASNGQLTPLDCASGDCIGHFSSFCLHELRPGPAYGSAYGIADGGTVTLVARTGDGRTLRLPAQDHLQFASRIGFTSVKVMLPKATRAAFDIVEAAVEVGPLVSLVPVAASGDPAPQTEQEIAVATGPMRKAASAAFEAPGPLNDAARVASAVINQLPEGASALIDEGGALWAKAVTPGLAATMTPEGMEMAQRLYEGCQISVESRTALSMRSCLELRHADLMAHRNQEFWKSLGGS